MTHHLFVQCYSCSNWIINLNKYNIYFVEHKFIIILIKLYVLKFNIKYRFFNLLYIYLIMIFISDCINSLKINLKKTII